MCRYPSWSHLSRGRRLADELAGLEQHLKQQEQASADQQEDANGKHRVLVSALATQGVPDQVGACRGVHHGQGNGQHGLSLPPSA